MWLELLEYSYIIYTRKLSKNIRSYWHEDSAEIPARVLSLSLFIPPKV